MRRRGQADVGIVGLSFKPSAGFPTFALKTVGDKPLKLTSGKWYYEITVGNHIVIVGHWLKEKVLVPLNVCGSTRLF